MFMSVYVPAYTQICFALCRNYWILYIKLDQVCPLLLLLYLAIELHWFLQRWHALIDLLLCRVCKGFSVYDYLVLLSSKAVSSFAGTNGRK